MRGPSVVALALSKDSRAKMGQDAGREPKKADPKRLGCTAKG